jgi:WD40 repeat protein
LLALPADDASEIALFILNPAAAGRDAEAYATLAAPSGTKPTGMCMCVDFHWIKRGAFVRAQQREKESDLPTRLGDEGGDGNTCWLDDHILALIAGYEDGTIIVWDVASLSAGHHAILNRCFALLHMETRDLLAGGVLNAMHEHGTVATR